MERTGMMMIIIMTAHFRNNDTYQSTNPQKFVINLSPGQTGQDVIRDVLKYSPALHVARLARFIWHGQCSAVQIISFDDRRILVWRQPRERFQDTMIRKHDCYGGFSNCDTAWLCNELQNTSA